MICSAHLRDVLLNLLNMEEWLIFLPIFDRYLNIVLVNFSLYIAFSFVNIFRVLLNFDCV